MDRVTTTRTPTLTQTVVPSGLICKLSSRAGALTPALIFESCPFRVVLHKKSAHRETTSERDVMRAVYIQPFEATAGPVFNQ
jgi:hypothetical protein